MPVQTLRVTGDWNSKISKKLKVVGLSVLRAGHLYDEFC